MQSVVAYAFCGTTFWIVAAWRDWGKARTRHIWAMAYDCSAIGLVMVGLGSDFMGLFAVLLWISVAYGFRYLDTFYLKLGIVLTSLTFIVSALVTRWSDWTIFVTLLITLILVPLIQLAPMAKIIGLIEKLDTANKDLEEAHKVTTKFISNVSHDLLTPVSAIVGYCESTPPDIDGIRVNADQLSRQIRAIIGQTVSAELVPNDEYLEEFSPLDLLNRTVTTVRPLAASRGLKIEVKQENILDMGLYFGAADAISICLMNLANNAAKHTDGYVIELRADYSDGQLNFYVFDDGSGIPEQHHNQLFNRFYRMNNSSEYGLGLGLTIVKDTVDKIGGKLTFSSSVSGTVFQFSVPAEPVDMVKSVQIAKPVLSTKNTDYMSILFVDDEYSGRQAWSTVLRTAGYYVHVAASGKEALEAIVSGNSYSLYILDYRMAEMTGLDLAGQIRKIDPKAKIMIISADVNNDLDGVFKEARQSGMINAALGKPIHPNKLLSTIAGFYKPSPPNSDGLIEQTRLELKQMMTELGMAIDQNDQQWADSIAHKARSLVSFLEDETIMNAMTSALSPTDVLDALELLHKAD
jgi:signal transduction histidine kinase/CheY-like chemotaxis protein